MSIQIRSAIILVLMTTFLMSCGGSKQVRSTPPPPVIKKTPSTSKPTSKSTKPKVVVATKSNKSTSKLSYKGKVQNYILTYKTIAKSEMEAYGIPASITLAQGILESGAGYGTLSQNANNHFGIKCHDWTGARVYHDDDKAQECFRKYDDASTSFKDHSLFLKNRKRYAKLFTYKKDDYKSWARGLKAAGYATDPKYPAKLISIIERYQLYTYDEEVLGTRRVKTTKEFSVVDRIVKNPPTPPTEDHADQQTTTPIVHRKIISNPTILTAHHHIVQKGETLYSISKRYNTTVAVLKSYNDLSNNTIGVGETLRVFPKHKIASTVTHIVKQGETLYSISQHYNSTVAALKSYNNLSDTTLTIGQVLHIQPTPEQEEF